MSAPDAIVLAYQETRDTIIREYGLRLVTTACVAWIVATVSAPATAILWWGAMAALLGAEALSYRYIFRVERESMPLRIATFLAVLSSFCALVYTFPVWVLLSDGAPAATFTAAAFMAGTLIHLTVHNANTRLIYISAAGPMSAAFLAVGVHLSNIFGSIVPLLTVVLFVLAMVAAYIGRLKNFRQLNDAMALAIAEREAARRASEAKSAFLAKMSHELRTPLNGMLGMAHALRAGELTAGQRDHADIIVSSGETLLEVLTEILDHATIEANRISLDKRPARIADVVSSAVRLFRSNAAQKGIFLDCDMSGVEAPHLVIDEPRLRQCLVNLVANAVKFTDSGGVLIRARTRRAESGMAAVEIDVADTGIGIPAEKSANIFDAFEQADNSIRRRFGGAGLGLAITRGLLRAMGGDISVASEPGKGSTFSLRFTTEIAEIVEPVAPDASAKAPIDFSGVCVLVVEDNVVNRKVVRALLEPTGAFVTEAADGEEALKRLEGQHFDIVLMDLHMPVMDGFAATRAIRNSRAPWSSIPVIALSAAALAEDREAGIAAGADDFLSKPVKPAALASAIADHLAHRSPALQPPAKAAG